MEKADPTEAIDMNEPTEPMLSIELSE